MQYVLIRLGKESDFEEKDKIISLTDSIMEQLIR